MNLIIVESPTKARTISEFLSPDDYKVESSYGHIRDLPKSKLGIDLEKNFQPQYILPVKSRERVSQLKKEAKKAKTVILATDLDREGEAIAWHLVKALDLDEIKNPQRIVFHEITKTAIEEALKNPRGLNMNLVDAQQARRVLDRLVGYKLSPFLWKKIMSRLSAGRVQSVALRLIAEREDEIRNFKPEEYWTIAALLTKLKTQPRHQKIGAPAEVSEDLNLKTFETTLYKINNEAIPKLGIKTKEEADKIVDELKTCDFKIKKIETKEIKKNPLAPFTTSSLQQEASKRLRFSAKQTMRLAQSLYESGLITYMRTDSLNLSKESVFSAKNWIEKNLGKEYSVQAPRFFKTKSRLAQEAHEAIRPTNPNLTPEKLTFVSNPSQEGKISQEKKLYDLIWRRFIASQLPQARFDSTRVEIAASTNRGESRLDNRREAKNSSLNTSYWLFATGNILRFDGFLKIWPAQFEEKKLPQLEENEELKLVKLNPLQHFTEPLPRYNEASLIKTLEEYGIGRPSTYAPIISVIQDRNYVYKNEQRRFQPTEIGEMVNKILVEHFPEIVDIQFTAKMEEELDEIAEGGKKWQTVIREFYEPFSQHLEKKYQEVEKQKPIEEKTDEICEKCGKPMVVKLGRYGKFLACSGFPECKNTKSLADNKQLITNDRGEEIKCPKCQEGTVIKRRTKKGRFFYGCSRYPACDFASWKKPEIEK